MINYQHLLEKVKAYAFQHITAELSPDLCFHDRTHTCSVVNAAEEMANYYKLNDEDHFILIAAAYFHDLGYAPNEISIGHENRSAALAVAFFHENNLPEDLIDKIRNCILATRMPQSPQNLVEEILCDADLFHLGTDQFESRNKLMRSEAETVLGSKIGKDVWRAGTIKLLREHHYHTLYAQEKLDKKKAENLNDLIKQQNKVKEKKNKKPERGIETMFRITSSNNQRLSDMADNKANILLTVNSIILSMVIAVLFRKLDSNEHLIIPTVIITVVVVATMVVAILSTIPKIPSGTFSKEQINNKTVNLLFFGNFYKMKLEDYKYGMEKVMDDSEFLYGMLTKDIYSQGVVLGRKYRLLRYAYGIFMFGLIVAVLAFIIATLY